MIPLAIGAILELIGTLNLGIGSGVELYRTVRGLVPKDQAAAYPELSNAEIIRLLKERATQGVAKWQQELAQVPDEG